MWFLWLNWRKSTFYPVTAPNDSKCWPIVTSSIQEPTASNCDITMTDSSRVVAMDAFLTHWCVGQWFNEFVKTRMCQVFQHCLSYFFYFVTPVFQHGASLVALIWEIVCRIAANIFHGLSLLIIKLPIQCAYTEELGHHGDFHQHAHICLCQYLTRNDVILQISTLITTETNRHRVEGDILTLHSLTKVVLPDSLFT